MLPAVGGHLEVVTIRRMSMALSHEDKVYFLFFTKEAYCLICASNKRKEKCSPCCSQRATFPNLVQRAKTVSNLPCIPCMPSGYLPVRTLSVGSFWSLKAPSNGKLLVYAVWILGYHREHFAVTKVYKQAVAQHIPLALTTSALSHVLGFQSDTYLAAPLARSTKW